MSTKDLSMGSIPSLSPETIRGLLFRMYTSCIEQKKEFKTLPSVFIWGQFGVGKSQTIRELAKELQEKTGKVVNVQDVRLLLYSPIDLHGIPTSNEDKTLAVWLKPKIFQMDPSKDVINLLFLDELSAAPPSVQAAAYQITLDRQVGEHKLPDNCIIVAAGNRLVDKSVAYQMPKALANRLLHLEMTSDPKSWHNWAVSVGIHPYITGFIGFNPKALNSYDPQNASMCIATPRTWEMASNILNTVSDDFSVCYQLLAGLIGPGMATELRTFVKIYSKLPNIDGIFKGTETKVPTSPDVLYALVSSLVAHALKYKDDMDAMANLVAYGNKLPPDFSVILLKDLMYIEKNYKNKLLRIPAFKRWLETKGRLLDAAR